MYIFYICFVQISDESTIGRKEKKLLDSLTPPYQHLLDDIVKLQDGVQFLVNMRKEFLVCAEIYSASISRKILT